MKCIKCKNEIKKGNKFCPNCGKKVKKIMLPYILIIMGLLFASIQVLVFVGAFMLITVLLPIIYLISQMFAVNDFSVGSLYSNTWNMLITNLFKDPDIIKITIFGLIIFIIGLILLIVKKKS